jgi:hypothetical protein
MTGDSAFVLIGNTLVNLQTICAATWAGTNELRLWFPGSSEPDRPSFTIDGPEAAQLWDVLKHSAQRLSGRETAAV